MSLPERSLIAQLRAMAQTSERRRKPRFQSAVAEGIGDDCAVLRIPPGTDSLVTTDFSLEGIHFRREWHSPDSVGHRCLVRGLSDIAAMGGQPVAAFLSLALPSNLPQLWVTRFARSLLQVAGRHKVRLAGGDTAQSPDGILADIIVLGIVPNGKAILRSGARAGDRIFVSGALGGSAAALRALRAGKTADASIYPRHFYPEPRLGLGRILRERQMVTAMIDTSDGLSTDLHHICEESRVGAEIDAALLPHAVVGRPSCRVEPDLALHGGEDYELLFTVPPQARVPRQLAGVPLTEIGRITRSRSIILRDSNGVARQLEARGWEHFSRGRKARETSH
jgi:thiamine-monophosphate kinase